MTMTKDVSQVQENDDTKFNLTNFTRLERKFLSYLREGYAVGEIAEVEHRSPGNVRTIIGTAYEKLCVRNAHGAVVEAIREGVIPLWGDPTLPDSR